MLLLDCNVQVCGIVVQHKRHQSVIRESIDSTVICVDATLSSCVCFNIVNLQEYKHVHGRIFVVELQIQLVNTSLWMNVLLVKLWIFSPLKLATAWCTILTLIHLSATLLTASDQLTHHSRHVTEVVPAASVKRFWSILEAQSVLYVLSVEMETSSESDLHASMLRLSVQWDFLAL